MFLERVCGFDALNFRLEVQLSFFAISTSPVREEDTCLALFLIVCIIAVAYRVSVAFQIAILLAVHIPVCVAGGRAGSIAGGGDHSAWWRCGRPVGLGRIARRVWSLGRDDVLCV